MVEKGGSSNKMLVDMLGLESLLISDSLGFEKDPEIIKLLMGGN